jgi:hypothetical protein
VLRNFVSFALVTVLLLVATGGVCLACSNQLAAKPTSCCDKANKCSKPSQKSQSEHAHCAAIPVSDLAIEAALKVLSTDLIAVPGSVNVPAFDAATALGYEPPLLESLFSPPDLCLLHCLILV